MPIFGQNAPLVFPVFLKRSLVFPLFLFSSVIEQSSLEKTFLSLSSTTPKAFDCVDHDKLWEALREMGMPDHLTSLLSNLYVGQEAAVRTVRKSMWEVKLQKSFAEQGRSKTNKSRRVMEFSRFFCFLSFIIYYLFDFSSYFLGQQELKNVYRLQGKNQLRLRLKQWEERGLVRKWCLGDMSGNWIFLCKEKLGLISIMTVQISLNLTKRNHDLSNFKPTELH